MNNREKAYIGYIFYIYTVPMVLNPKGIEPTFLKFDSWSPGAGFIPIITSNIFNQIKKKRIQEKKTVLFIQKTFNAVFRNRFNPVLGSIPRLPIYIYGTQ